MKITDVCKEYVYEPEKGVKITYRKMPQVIFMGIMLSRSSPAEVKKLIEIGKLDEDTKIEESKEDVKEKIKFNLQDMILSSLAVVEHPNSIVGWEGIQDNEGNELKFKIEQIKSLDFNVIIKLYNLITGDTLKKLGLNKKKAEVILKRSKK